METALNLFIDELVINEDFRDSFLRSPRRALRTAQEWGLPLADSEIQLLLDVKPGTWDRVAEELGWRLQAAA